MDMLTSKYEKFVESKAKTPINELAYSFIGLAGETGEAMEWLKKSVYRQNPKYTPEMLLSELGDIQHYLTRIALYYGWTLKDVMNENMRKLEERHGTGKY